MSHSDVGAMPPLVCRVPPREASGLHRAVYASAPGDVIRVLLLASTAEQEPSLGLRVSHVLDLDGVFVAQDEPPRPCPVEVREAYEAALGAIVMPRMTTLPNGQPDMPATAVEFWVDRTGGAQVAFYCDASFPPPESGAEHHVWHYSPQLDELKEALTPDTWWQRVSENVSTWVRKIARQVGQ